MMTCSWLVAVLHFMALQGVYSLDDSKSSASGSRVRKRSYNPWALPLSFNSISVYDAGKLFKPASQSISPPYYIPVYGVNGGNYIFYPPQKIYENVGDPVDNPSGNKEYQAPAYLPPKPTVGNRLGGDDDDRPTWGNDNLPIWGISRPSVVQMPLVSGSKGQPKEYTTVAPTRPPLVSTTRRPPLVHADGFQQQAEAVAQVRPEKPAIQQPAQEPITIPQRPRPTPAGPSNCVWAIVSCCSATAPNAAPHNCFEQRGCPGPFWGNSPCSSEFARAAINAAVEYYDRNPAGGK